MDSYLHLELAASEEDSEEIEFDPLADLNNIFAEDVDLEEEEE